LSRLLIEIIDNTTVNIIEEDDNGVKKSKPINPNSLITIAKDCIETIIVRSGRIPNNDMGLLEMSFESPNIKKSMILYVPPYATKINTSVGRYSITFPPLIFGIQTIGGKVTSTTLFCCKENAMNNINSKTPLFRYPFAHVYEGGRICWGSVCLPTHKSLGDFRTLPYLFMDSFHTLSHMGYNNSLSDLSPNELLMKLQNKQINVLDILKPLNQTYENFANSFLGVEDGCLI